MSAPGYGSQAKRSRNDGLSYEDWCKLFFADAQAQGLLRNAERLNDVALQLFWRDGVAPTVRALLESGAPHGDGEARPPAQRRR